MRAAETVGIATLGTLAAALLALPLALLSTRQTVPARPLYHPRAACSMRCAGIDGFVFALLFVAAVGLGPFAGMLGVALHSAGLHREALVGGVEAVDPRPAEAILSAGGTRLQVARFALIPQTIPQTASALLYVWEFNIRASTVLGLVGAGRAGAGAEERGGPAGLQPRARHPSRHHRADARRRPHQRRLRRSLT
jgi:phosphonate transport system permease protein